MIDHKYNMFTLKYKWLNIRYDQKIISYNEFLLLAISHILNKKCKSVIYLFLKFTK